MNWKRLTLLSGVALAAVAIPQATAQDQMEAPVSSPRAQMSAPSAPAMSNPRPSNHSRGGGDWRTRDGSSTREGNWRGGDGRRWRHGNHRHGNHRHWRHRHHYRPRSYSYYPYGFGYGYGYPFWGASADLYYNGYHPQYYAAPAVNRGGGSVVAQVQQELANAGFYRGPIDGVIGNGTRNAIRAYERANGLRVDGRIDNQLLGTMGLS